MLCYVMFSFVELRPRFARLSSDHQLPSSEESKELPLPIYCVSVRFKYNEIKKFGIKG